MAAGEVAGCAGYWVVDQNGAVAAFGAVINFGSAPQLPAARVVAITATPDYDGYWLLTSNGRVYAFGDAPALGSAYKDHPASPLVGMATTSDGNGYWLVSASGHVYAYGDALSFGSVSRYASRLNGPIAGIAASPHGRGYWLVGTDGGVFGFGTVDFFGSVAQKHLRGRIVGIAPAASTSGYPGPSHPGYTLAAADGGIFAFGSGFYGSLANRLSGTPLEAITPAVGSNGYYVMNSGGQIYAYGDARYLGNAVR